METLPASLAIVRQRAVEVDETSLATIPLAEVWNRLCRGERLVTDTFLTSRRCYLVLSPEVPNDSRKPLGVYRRSIVEGLLQGCQAKSIALDLCRSHSTVAQEAKRALQQLGIECTPARVHPLVAMAAQEAAQSSPRLLGRFAKISGPEGELWVVGTARPDDALARLLSPAEYAVARCLIEGLNYDEIARSRGTSPRTVANQLAAVFRRVGVTGRCRLVQYLACSAVAYG